MKYFAPHTVVALGTILAGSFGFSDLAEATSFYLGNGLNVPEVGSFFSYTKDGIGLTTTGILDNGNGRNVYRSLLGSGVTKEVLFDGDDNQIDGVGPDETLVLTFNQVVNLVSVTFSRVGDNDDFKLFVDGNQFIAADIPGGNFLDLDISNFIFNPSPTGTKFGFTVIDKKDDYLVKYVEVNAVPEPLTILGAGTAIAFGTSFKRKLGKAKNK
ncbi:PEP-CTERM sorting domain-containing protein [Crocosphaera subtropica]|nr:PEP-CTERM sorting domain-containing protein [Crocosphaera subtropica]